MKKSNLPEFIYKANIVHNNFYNYSLAEYVSSNTKICIACPEHGMFFQTPANHLHGYGCRLCGLQKAGQYHKKDTIKFIREAKSKHGDKYDYSLAEYKGAREKLTIICNKHGAFRQTAHVHLRGENGAGCAKCSYEERAQSAKMSFKEFVEISEKKHGSFYDYSKSRDGFNGVSRGKITIICPIHGEFQQSAQAHSIGKGCNLCSTQRTADTLRKSTMEFIEDATKVHGFIYDYSRVLYKGSFANVEILCPTDGSFYQSPTSHLSGTGCPKCSRRNQGAPRNLKRALRGEFDKKIEAYVYVIEFSLPVIGLHSVYKIGSGTGNRKKTVQYSIQKIGGIIRSAEYFKFNSMGSAIVFEHLAHQMVEDSRVIIPIEHKFPGHSEVFAQRPDFSLIYFNETFRDFVKCTRPSS